MRRRTFVGGSLAAAASLLTACDAPDRPRAARRARADSPARRMPDEGEPHRRTWMAFGASEDIWGAKLLPRVQRDLAAVATTIARFEPVAMLVRPTERGLAQSLVGANVELIAAEIDDLWMRDTGPVFVRDESGTAGVDFNFNGWGDKQEHRRDAKVAGLVTERAGARAVHTELILEGGGIEVDGAGTAIVTESCVLNDNRNPGWQRSEVEAELRYLLGIEKVIWLPGIAGHDITDGHTDFYARFTGPGVVVAGLENDPRSFDHNVTRRHLDILRSATDAHGRPLRVEVLAGPSRVRERFASNDFAAGYINFYVCNGAVIAPEFGDVEADAAARDTLTRLFPGRQVVQLDIDAIAAGGGGIHCTTQQDPA
ncbi:MULTISPECIES: agmatine deiminase family protein [Nocardia]|uniref:agmatine deiminase family protein n=1 Tax=Nocardia TaxID=1817 RepID=UPI0027E2D4FD|nr:MULTISPECIES: agmatine deiminase family protein [Nocardia]